MKKNKMNKMNKSENKFENIIDYFFTFQIQSSLLLQTY